MKKILTYFVILLVLLTPVLGVDAAKKKGPTTTTTTQIAGKKVNFYVFYGSTCGFCKSLHEYIATLQQDPTINYMFELVDKEVWGDKENNLLMTEVGKEMNFNIKGVPVYVIGEKIFSGYSSDSNQTIVDAIKEAYTNPNTKDVVAPIAAEVLSGDRTLSESQNNKTVGFIILGVTAIIVIAILFSKNNNTYSEDEDDDDDDDDDDFDEDDDEDEPKEKTKVKKTTTKSSTTKSKTTTKRKK